LIEVFTLGMKILDVRSEGSNEVLDFSRDNKSPLVWAIPASRAMEAPWTRNPELKNRLLFCHVQMIAQFSSQIP
jgi:hypothetical protein